MKKLLELIKKARKYIGVALGYLKKLLVWGKKTDAALSEAEKQLEEDKE